MPKTIGDVITEARDILQDEQEPYRYTTDRLYAYLNRAFLEIKAIRPDAYWGRYVASQYPPSYDIPEYAAGDEAELWPLSTILFAPTVEYVAGAAELKDDEFTNDSRAAILLTMFRNKLTAVPR